MRAEELPESITQYFGKIKNWETNLSERAVDLIIKLVSGWQLTQDDLEYLVDPAEIAAIWSVMSKHPIHPNYVRQIRRLGRIKEAKSEGSGRETKRWYTIAEIKDIRVSSQRGPREGFQSNPPKYPPKAREERKRRQSEPEAA
jgi:hypothetical protein